ncbi:MAG: cysteine desulfurase-like protein [Gemmatimonadetes bacterium]|nr:cysteine desulfurase-like protein [Gemmatimonadota bacterium]
MQQTFDVEAVRAQFPALSRLHDGKPVAYFDGPGGSQVARSSIDAMTRYMERGGANLHGVFPTSTETEEILAGTRSACAAFLGAEPDEVAFGANMTTLTLAISRALSNTWDEDSEIVVTELDHRANVDPWLIVAEEKGAKIRWIDVDPETLTLNLNDLDQKINPNTKLVAVGLASNAVGTVNDVAAVAERAHAVGAVVAVDAVHAAPHVPMDRDGIGADVLTCSAYKFFGPHVGVTAIRRGLFEELAVHRLDPAPDHIPDKLETGTQNHEGIAGVRGALEFIASLGEGGSSREKFLDAMRTVEEHETRLADRFREALREIPGVTLYAAPDTVRKTPTVAFRLEGRAPLEVCQHAADHGFFIAAGDFYASTVAERLGIKERGGFVRAGLAPYNTEEEVEGFVGVLRGLVR